MDFWRAIAILSKRKWLILLSVLVSVVLTYGATRLIGARWTATVTFTTPSGTLANAAGIAEQPAGDPSQLAIFTAMARSQAVVGAALERVPHITVPSTLLENIDVKTSGPRMFAITVTDSVPWRAEALANAIADAFVEQNRKMYTDQVDKVVDLLRDQLKDADAKLVRARDQYDVYRRKHGIALNLVDSIGPAFYRLQNARQRRDDVLERLAESRSRLAHLKGELQRLPATVPVERTAADRPLVQQLETDLARAEAALTSLRARYTDEWPEVKLAVAQRDALKSRLDAERLSQPRPTGAQQPNPELADLNRNISNLEEQIAANEAQLASLETNLASAQREVSGFSGIDSPLGALAAEITAQSEARSNLVARLEAARMAADAAGRQNPVVILDRVGELNPPVNATAGRTRKLLALAAICAVLGMSGLIIALDSVDRRVRTVGDAERILPAPVVAAIPQPSGPVTAENLPRATELHPLSLHSEAYRFLGLHLLNSRARRVRSLMVVSTKADQGGTSTVANLGITLAQAGYRVLIVDANVRTPQIHDVFRLPNEVGLTSLLQAANEITLEEAVRRTTVPNLEVITGGPQCANPWELLRSPRLMDLSRRMRERADYVLYDTPSALAFTDALNLAPAVDAAFLCVRALEPPSGAEQQLVDTLKHSNVTVLGSVLNDMPPVVLDSYPNYRWYYPVSGEAAQVIEAPPVSGIAVGAGAGSGDWVRFLGGDAGPSNGHGTNGHGTNGNGKNGNGHYGTGGHGRPDEGFPEDPDA